MAQHWVPQHILRGFSTDGKTVWQYDKTGEIPPTRVGIKGAFGRNDAFDAPVEQLMSTIENAAYPAIEALRNMEQHMRIDAVAKRIVAVYLTMFLWRRSPAARDRLVSKTNEVDLVRLGRKGAENLDDAVRDRLEAILPAVAGASDVNSLMAGHWSASTFVRWLFYSMSWAVLRCTAPVVTVPDQGLIWLGSRGLLDPKAEFYFPLSSRRVLVTSWQGSPQSLIQLLPASPAHMRGINKHGFARAGRFVCGQRRDQKLAAAVQKAQHHFPKLEPLAATGGPNPTAAKLSHLSSWIEGIGSDNPNRHWCMAPGADRHCHQWRPSPSPIAVTSDLPDHKVPARFCQWCGAIERENLNGHIEFDDMELQRTQAQPPWKNWWQSFVIVDAGGRIKSRNVAPSASLTGGEKA